MNRHLYAVAGVQDDKPFHTLHPIQELRHLTAGLRRQVVGRTAIGGKDRICRTQNENALLTARQEKLAEDVPKLFRVGA